MSADSFCSGVCSQRNEDDDAGSQPDREQHWAELQGLKPSQLRQRASIVPGVESQAVEETDDLMDGDERRAALIELIIAAPRREARGKLFNDCVHEHFELPWLCVKVMDTPEFQRMRDLKQLGGTYNVFTCAAHNRFEHSLGTAHLAGRVASQLRKLQPSLGITEKDVLCCQLAGLCHDLGHGPMSHMFDGKFLNKMKEKTGDAYVPPHEELSTQLLDHLIAENDLLGAFEKVGLDDIDIIFIKEMIDHVARGDLPMGGEDGDGEKPERAGVQWFKYGGRPVEKQFLYEIISNDVNGVDVDKFDYFMRDAKFLNIPITFDPKRLMANTRVARSNKDGKLHIAFQVKEAWNLYELFHTRYTLHKRAYQHKTANSIEEMLCEVMVLAEPHLRMYRGAKTDPATGELKVYTPYESLNDMGAYAKLADSVFHDIEVSLKPEMEMAQDLLKKVRRRELYPFIGESVIRQGAATRKKSEEWCKIVTAGVFEILADTERIEEALRAYGNCGEPGSSGDKLGEMMEFARELVHRRRDGTEEDLIVQIVKINYGMGTKDPVKEAIFYDTEMGADGAEIPMGTFLESERISSMVPKAFEEKYIRLYSRYQSAFVKPVIRSAFFTWAKQEGEEVSTQGGCLVEPPTPARSSLSMGAGRQTTGGKSAAGGGAMLDGAQRERMESMALSPSFEQEEVVVEVDAAAEKPAAAARRKTPSKVGKSPPTPRRSSGDGGPKKKLRLGQ